MRVIIEDKSSRSVFCTLMNYLKVFFPRISSCTFIHSLRSDVQYCISGKEKIYTPHCVAAQGPSISFAGLSQYSTKYSFTFLLQLLGFVKVILNAIVNAGVLPFT